MKVIDQILYWASVNQPSLYEDYLLEKYEEEYGPHFNEEKAREAVNEMYHCENGTKIYGEHWTIEEIKSVKEKYKEYFPEGTTCWDLYVALHMWWHDLGTTYKKRGLPETMLIEDAITWSFLDEDAPDGKIWHYIQAM